MPEVKSGREAARREWTTPVMKRLRAASAELAGGVGIDAESETS